MSIRPGLRVQLRGVSSIHDEKQGTVSAFVLETGRWKVTLDSGHAVAVKPVQMELIDSSAVESTRPICKHGGAISTPAFRSFMSTFLSSPIASTMASPNLQHVRLLEPLICTSPPSAQAVASLGMSAFLAGDFGTATAFAAVAVIVRSMETEGPDVVLGEIRLHLVHQERRVKLARNRSVGRCAVCLKALSTADEGASPSRERPTLLHSCTNCGAVEADTELATCQCKLARFCSNACAEVAWPAHSKVCMSARSGTGPDFAKLPCGHAIHGVCVASHGPEGGRDVRHRCVYCRRPLAGWANKLQAQLVACGNGCNGLRDTLMIFSRCDCLLLAKPPATPVTHPRSRRLSVGNSPLAPICPASPHSPAPLSPLKPRSGSVTPLGSPALLSPLGVRSLTPLGKIGSEATAETRISSPPQVSLHTPRRSRSGSLPPSRAISF